MKKVLCGLVIAVMMTGSGYTETVKLNQNKVDSSIYISTLCVDGYKFVMAHRTKTSKNRHSLPSRGEEHTGVSTTNNITQHFSIQDGKSLPTQC